MSKSARRKNYEKARNMRKNNGVGRTAARIDMHNAVEASKKETIGSKLAAGMKKIFNK